MFYYAEIDGEYLVVNTHSLAEESTNSNYVTITEEEYTSGDLIGMYYNSLYDRFEIMSDEWVCGSELVSYNDTDMQLTTKLDNMQAEINALSGGSGNDNSYASADDLQALVDDLQVLEDVVATKADADHVHTEYASATHSHDEYVLQTDFDVLAEEVDSKAESSHTHSEYALTDHVHDEYALSAHSHSEYASSTHSHNEYSSISHTHTASEIGAASSDHNHDADYSDISHSHDGVYSSIGHDHDETYALISHAHADYATVTALDELSETVANKANASHVHDDTYYTETEVNTLLAGKADTSHAHTGIYDVIGAAADALTSANAYTDSKINALVGEGASTTLDTIGEISSAIEDNQDAIDLLNAAIANKANASALTSHTGDTTIHITEAERTSWNAKSDFSGSYDDLTNKPTIPSIDGLATETYVDAKVSAVTAESIGALPNTTVIPTVPTNVSAFANDAGYLTEHQSLDGLATEAYVDEAVSAKADSSHMHAIADVTNLQSVLDAKATQTSLDTHASNTTLHTNATERTNWNTAYTHSQSAHAPSDAEANQNAFSSVVVGSTTIAADSATDTLTFVAGTNVTITPDATNDKITISATDTNTTYSAGTGISLSGTTFSNSGVRSIATGSSNGTISVNTNGTSAEVAVKGLGSAAYTASSAYDTAGSASSALASAKTYADSVGEAVKSDLLNGAGTAYDTLKELGDLIDENVDAIDALEAVAAGKADASHTHAISEITNLQSTLDGKAASSHGTHVTYSTTAPVMDGTASVGSATTVARSDHKHPTDTSRASQTDLDALETVVAGKANTSHTHAISDVTNLQTSLDAKQATITGGASTIASSNLTTGRALISDSSGKVAVSAVTSTELGYLDGVTSNVQTQLDGKSASGHTHAATNITSGTLSSDRLPTVPISKGGTGATTAADALANLGAAKAAYKTYTSFGTASEDTDGWYTLFSITDSSHGSALCLLKGYAHSSVVFTATKGYSANTTLNILDCNTIHNDGYAHITALRILSDGKVQAKIHTGTVNFSINILTANGDISPVSSLVCDTSSPTVCIERTLVHGKMSAGGFVGDVSGNATTATTATKLGSSTVGGTAKPIYLSSGTATACSSTVGSVTQPVYMNAGTITACTYSLNKTVPSNAVFTDTVYTHPSYTARTGVPTANATLSHGGTFTVTQPVCDATGHITALNTRTYTLPSDNNTDTKVTNTLATTTKAYVTGTTSASTNTGTQVFDTGVYLDTTAGQLVASTFKGVTFSGDGVATVSEVETYLGI